MCSKVHCMDVGMYRHSPLLAFHAHQKTLGMALCSPSLAEPAYINAGDAIVRHNQDQGYFLLAACASFSCCKQQETLSAAMHASDCQACAFQNMHRMHNRNKQLAHLHC